MFSRTLFTLALLSAGAMGGVIRNVNSRYFLTSDVTLDWARPLAADWKASCTGSQGDPRRSCTFRNTVYTYDSGQGVVIGHAESGTQWTVDKRPLDSRVVYNQDGLCWTQHPDRPDNVIVYLDDCIFDNTYQWWDIPGL